MGKNKGKGKGTGKAKAKASAKSAGNVQIRHKPLYTESKEAFGKSYLAALDRMKMRGANGYFRQNMFGYEIVWNGKKRHYSKSTSRKSSKYLYIFALVKKDALKYLKTHEIKKTSYLSSIHKNPKMVGTRKKVTGVDIDTAYWDIAFRLGIISGKTHDHGILIPDKGLGHAAMSSLGKHETFTEIKNGELTNHRVKVLGDPELKAVYNLIRHTCYKYLSRLARILGPDDYVERRTDAIYYVDNDRNNRIVREFMRKEDFDFKPGLPPPERSKKIK